MCVLQINVFRFCFYVIACSNEIDVFLEHVCKQKCQPILDNHNLYFYSRNTTFLCALKTRVQLFVNQRISRTRMQKNHESIFQTHKHDFSGGRTLHTCSGKKQYLSWARVASLLASFLFRLFCIPNTCVNYVPPGPRFVLFLGTVFHLALNSSCFSNTCAKYARPGSDLLYFSNTCGAAARVPNSLYYSNT